MDEDKLGDPLTEAVYERNLAMEEKYNISVVSVTEKDHGAVANAMKTATAAGDKIADVVFSGLSHNMALVTSGIYQAVNSLPYVQTENSWWMGDILASTSIAHKNFFLISDANIGTMNTAGIAYFNKTVLTDNKLESPYTYVDNGTWTLEKMQEMSAVVTRDVNGDGIFDPTDHYGTECSSFAWQPFFYGSGQYMITKDSNDIPKLNVVDEKNISYIQKIISFLNNDDTTYNVNHSTGYSDLGALTIEMFEEGRALFFIELIYGVPTLREMKDDFGILPLPKASESQQEYSTYLHPDNSTGIFLPVLTTDLETVGYLLEDFAFYSGEYVRPAFYNIMLKSKYARDEDSARMLDIVLSSFTVDLGLIMKSAGINIDSTLRSSVTNNNQSIVSTLTAQLETYQGKLDTFVDYVQKNVK